MDCTSTSVHYYDSADMHHGKATYKKPTKVLSVDIEDVLKAEQVCDPASDIQL